MLGEGERRILAADADAARLTALVLLEHATGVAREQLLAWPEASLDLSTVSSYRDLVDRRCRREPVAYILGWREFFGRRFRVSPATLIPRPETEGLVELALRHASRQPQAQVVLDVGTGSGAIAITLLAERTELRAVATDLDVDALLVARENARAHEVDERLSLVAGDLADALRGTFSLIVANLPYVPSAQIEGLGPEIATFEPRRALDGGPDGTGPIARLLSTLPHLLASSGVALFEIGDGRASRLRGQIKSQLPGFQSAVECDAAGAERYLVVERGRG